MVTTSTQDADVWSFASLLRGLIIGDSCSCQVQKRKTASQNHRTALYQSIVRVHHGVGDCGPDTAAWLLNEHGSELKRSNAPETRSTVRVTLQQTWRRLLDTDSTGIDAQNFVLHRLEQVPETQAKTSEELDEDMGLHEQVALTLRALLRGEDTALEDDTVGHAAADIAAGPFPYWFVPSDWARLSEAYQVDFVVHGLPGTESQLCEYCNSMGHVHFGSKAPGVESPLHVCWRSAVDSSDDLPKGIAAPASNTTGGNSGWGHWEPLGTGPIQRKEIQVYGAPPRSTKQLLEDGAERTFGEDQAIVIDEHPHSSVPKFWAGLAICSRGIGAPNCQEGSPCDSTCPRRNCQGLCPLCEKPGRAQRGHSEEESTIHLTLRAAGSLSSRIPSQTVAEPVRTALQITNVGARFCIFLEGAAISFVGAGSGGSATVNGCEGGTGGTSARGGEEISTKVTVDSLHRDAADAGVTSEADLAYRRFREAFAASIAATADIAPSRVKILDVGPPLIAALSTPVAGASADFVKLQRASPKSASRNDKFDSPRGQQQENPAQRVDTGAGVLSFLEDEPTMTAVERCLSNDAGSGGSCGAASPRSERSVTRILFLIRERYFNPNPTGAVETLRAGSALGEQACRGDEEMDALRALEKVVDALNTSDVALLSALQPWLVEAGGDVRIWCPEVSRIALPGSLALSRAAARGAQRGTK